jgi:hypothetical protein
MPKLKLNQLQYESDTWKRFLAFMKDENVHLKNRLAEILKSSIDNNLLDDIENFYSGFLKEDELIDLLRIDVAELDRLLAREIVEDGKLITRVDKKMKSLRNNIENAEQHFGRMKSEFISYLSENIQ